MVTSLGHAHGRADCGGISVAPKVPIEPEIETRPEPEITTCEKGLGATRSYPTDTASLFTFSDKPSTLTVPTSQEVTETSLLTCHGSVSAFNVGISIFSSRFGISKYRDIGSVFQLVHFKGHG